MSDDELMTLAEVAAFTRLSENTLRYYRARRRGEGPASFRAGRRVIYRRSAVEEWLRDRESLDRVTRPPVSSGR